MNLAPEIVRDNPQLAALAMLTHVTETAIIVLCAAHPAIEHHLEPEPLPSLDRLAEHVVDHAMSILDAVDRYRRLLDDLSRLHRGLLAADDEPIF
jgi:hypothetical protein